MKSGKRGDLAIEAILAEGHWLRQLAASLTSEGSEDAVQQTYLAAITSPPHLNRPVRPWLARVLRNFVSMRRRGSGRRARLHGTLAEQPAPSFPSPEDLLAQHEAQQLVARAVSALEEPYRSTVLLCYNEGLSPAEIAERLQLPGATVRSRLKRGLEQLRARLDCEHGGDRRVWCALLLPIARDAPGPLTPPRGRAGVPLLAGALAVATLAVTVRLVSDRELTTAATATAPAFRADTNLAPPGIAPSATTPPMNEHTKGDQAMTRTKENRTRALTVAVAALAAAFSSGAHANDEIPREEAITECVKIREKVLVCKEEYAEQAVAQYLSNTGKTVSDQQRAKMKANVLDRAIKDGAGPLPERRASCERMLNLIGKSGVKPTRAGLAALNACFEAADCRQRIACYVELSNKIVPNK